VGLVLSRRPVLDDFPATSSLGSCAHNEGRGLSRPRSTWRCRPVAWQARPADRTRRLSDNGSSYIGGRPGQNGRPPATSKKTCAAAHYHPRGPRADLGAGNRLSTEQHPVGWKINSCYGEGDLEATDRKPRVFRLETGARDRAPMAIKTDVRSLRSDMVDGIYTNLFCSQTNMCNCGRTSDRPINSTGFSVNISKLLPMVIH